MYFTSELYFNIITYFKHIDYILLYVTLFNCMLFDNVLQTGLYYVYTDAHFVCLYCMPIFSLYALRLTKFY